jgi:DNA polymerase III sliding clamp (beta) subunit (PCNA family)
MKITKDARSQFIAALTIAANAAGKAESWNKQERSHLLFQCEGDRVHISASDGEITTTTTAPAQCCDLMDCMEAFTAPAATLLKIAKMMPEGDLYLTSGISGIRATNSYGAYTSAKNFNTATLQVGSSKYEFVNMPAEEMEIETPTGEPDAYATVKAGDLRDALTRVIPFSSKGAHDGPLHCVNFIIQGESLSLTATDKHRLYSRDVWLRGDAPAEAGEFNLPRPQCDAWIKALKTADDYTLVTIEFRQGEEYSSQRATLSFDGVQITAATYDSQFPDTAKVQRVNPIGHVTLSRKALEQLVKQCAAMKPDHDKVTFTFDGNELRATGRNMDNGSFALAEFGQGTAFGEMALNIKYLQDAIKHTAPEKRPYIKGLGKPEDNVTIEFCITTSGNVLARIDGVYQMGMATDGEDVDYSDYRPEPIDEPTPEPLNPSISTGLETAVYAPPVSEPEATPEPTLDERLAKAFPPLYAAFYTDETGARVILPTAISEYPETVRNACAARDIPFYKVRRFDYTDASFAWINHVYLYGDTARADNSATLIRFDGSNGRITEHDTYTDALSIAMSINRYGNEGEIARAFQHINPIDETPPNNASLSVETTIEPSVETTQGIVPDGQGEHNYSHEVVLYADTDHPTIQGCASPAIAAIEHRRADQKGITAVMRQTVHDTTTPFVYEPPPTSEAQAMLYSDAVLHQNIIARMNNVRDRHIIVAKKTRPP